MQPSGVPASKNEISSTTIVIVLPNKSSQNVLLQIHAKVSDLKIICESCFGIPTEIQKLLDGNGVELEDHLPIISIAFVQLQVPIWWHKLICNVLDSDLRNVCTRVQLPMQHVGRDERIFVALFMGCCRGMSKLVSLLVELEHNVDINTTTDSRRNVLHACALGGDLRCLETVVKYLRKSCQFDSFESLDKNRQTPYQIALKRDKKEVVEWFIKYMNSDAKQIENVNATAVPHQRQANLHYKINNCLISDENIEEKDKQNKESDSVESADSVKKVCPPNYTRCRDGQRRLLVSPVNKELYRRAKEDSGNNVTIKVDSGDKRWAYETEKETHLPNLVIDYSLGAYQHLRESRSTELIAAVECKSAPNSPVTRRSSCNSAKRLPLQPSSSMTTLEKKGNHIRRRSLATCEASDLIHLERNKSRSVCEVTFRESLNNHMFSKAMQTQDRLDLPWNAWIAAKRQDYVESSMVTPILPKSPGTRRRSFVQWLSEKDLDHLQQKHADFHCKLQNNTAANERKGKSFEEWLEDKHNGCKKEKEIEKIKNEDEKKIRRRKMSEQKYQSWLEEKELKDLEAEVKSLREAQEKFEKMKRKWEAEDKMKQKFPLPTGVQKVTRTNCGTASSNSKTPRQRFRDLQYK